MSLPILTVKEAEVELKVSGWKRRRGLWFNNFFKHIPHGVSFGEACSLAQICFRDERKVAK